MSNNIKFNIFSFNQKILINFKLKKIKKDKDGKEYEFEETLNLNDLYILQYFRDFQDTGKMTTICNNEGEEFKWVKYDYFCEQLPILKLDKQKIARIFSKLVNFKILKHYHHKIKGSFSCYKINSEIIDLILFDNNQSALDIENNIKTLYQKLQTPLSKMIDPSIKNDRANNYSVKNDSVKHISYKYDIDDLQSSQPKNEILEKVNHSKKEYKLEYKNAHSITQFCLNYFYDDLIKSHPKVKKENFYNEKEIYTSNTYIKYFLNGFPKVKHNDLRKWVKDEKLNFDFNNGFKEDETFLKAFKMAMKIFKDEYPPIDKSKLPTRLSTFLINSFSQLKSSFLLYSTRIPNKLETEKEDRYKEITDRYIKEFLKEEPKTAKEKNGLILAVKNFVSEYNVITTVVVDGKKYSRFDLETDKFALYLENMDDFIGSHIDYLNYLVEKNSTIQPGYAMMSVYNKWWLGFCKHYENEFGIDLYSSQEELEYKVKKYLNSKKKNS